MKGDRFSRFAYLPALCAFLLFSALVRAQTDPLPSWNDGAAKKAIVEFVKSTTTQGGPTFVPAPERIATFDQDGTLWVEQPMYAEVMFAFDQLGALLEKYPKLKYIPPFKTVMSGDQAAIARLSNLELDKIVALVTHSGMTVEAFQKSVDDWITTAKHPRYQRLYTELVYQPMLEVMTYLRANGYKTYLVTGGGQDFVRAFANRVYGVPPEQVVGTAADTTYGYDKAGKSVLNKTRKMLLVDDKAGKPVGIHLVIGRRPVAAFGNSSGDQQMLEYAQDGGGARLMMLVSHDDATRESAYGPDSKIGTFPDTLMNEAKKRGWTVISMKNDWKKIFAFETK